MLRSLGTLLAIATAQAVLTIALTVAAFSESMARFDTGAPASAWALLAGGLLNALSFPLLPLIASIPPSIRPSGFPAEHLLFLANGLIWAVAIRWLARRLRQGNARNG